MRPRFMNRGSALARMRRASLMACFNEAPIHESGKSAHVRNSQCGLVASMRPRFMNRGSIDELVQTARNKKASMRPRFMNRGSAPNGIKVHFDLNASMRPRFMNRGSTIERTQCRTSFRFNEAPIHESGK